MTTLRELWKRRLDGWELQVEEAPTLFVKRRQIKLIRSIKTIWRVADRTNAVHAETRARGWSYDDDEACEAAEEALLGLLSAHQHIALMRRLSAPLSCR